MSEIDPRILLTKLAFGPSPYEAEELAPIGTHRWVDEQLRPTADELDDVSGTKRQVFGWWQLLEGSGKSGHRGGATLRAVAERARQAASSDVKDLEAAGPAGRANSDEWLIPAE